MERDEKNQGELIQDSKSPFVFFIFCIFNGLYVFVTFIFSFVSNHAKVAVI